MRSAVLAIDIGGTKLAAALVGPAGELVGEPLRVPTPVGDGEQVFAAVTALAGRVLAGSTERPAAAGVGCGGPMRWPAGEVSPLNIPGWRGFPLRSRLAAQLGLDVRLHNDAVCLAVGEHWRGAGRGVGSMLGMVVSTGVGGGLVIRDRLVDGATGNAGHVGHIVVDPGGAPCSCGGRGCLEAVARGPAVVAWARERGWSPAGAAPADGVLLAAAARAGDPVAAAAFERAGAFIGVALASAVALCDLELVVVGGGLSAAEDLLLPPLRAAFARHARLPFAVGVPIVAAALGQSAGLLGAAALVLAGDRYWSAG